VALTDLHTALEVHPHCTVLGMTKYMIHGQYRKRQVILMNNSDISSNQKKNEEIKQHCTK